MRQVLRLVPQLNSCLQGAAAAACLPVLPACTEVLALLESALADEPPATLATPGMIRPGFDAELDGLMDKSRHAKDWIANLEQVERQRLDIKSLKVGYNKVFGYYIEVTNTHAGKTPPEYIRKQTIANGERYITPELKEYETLVLNADERRLEIEQALFGEVCSQISQDGARLLQLGHALAELDVFTALAEVALLRRYVRPIVDEGQNIEISGGRHPVVELALHDEPFVPNDTHLGPECAVQLITRPQYERQKHLFAPDSLDYLDGASRQLCASRPCHDRRRRSHLYAAGSQRRDSPRPVHRYGRDVGDGQYSQPYPQPPPARAV